MREGMTERAPDQVVAARDAVKTGAGMIPTEAFLIGALGSIALSLALKLGGRDRDAEFVGHWAPTFLSLGLFAKLLERDRESSF